jgi:hypothetical protein
MWRNKMWRGKNVAHHKCGEQECGASGLCCGKNAAWQESGTARMWPSNNVERKKNVARQECGAVRMRWGMNVAWHECGVSRKSAIQECGAARMWSGNECCMSWVFPTSLPVRDSFRLVNVTAGISVLKEINFCPTALKWKKTVWVDWRVK